jgi:aminoglycoside phosphotransferase family enzyme/predicted kinase
MTKSIENELIKSSAYPNQPDHVDMLQTHISFIFLTDDYVYKVKKPVDFGFLDFTSLDKRLHYCKKEVELNKRLSPDVYLGVVRITDEGETLVIDGKGETIDYAVKMRKIPMEKIMVKLLGEGKITPEMVGRAAKKIAKFHDKAATSPDIDKFGTMEVIKTNTDENFQQTEKYIEKSISKNQFEAIKSYTNRFYETKRAIIEQRIADHKIKDCHGDLHMQHVVFADDIIIFDCIEFNERFRYSDTAADIAFLAMDLDYNNRADLSKVLIDAYAEHSKDNGVYQMLNFYKIYRAYVRGKVISFQLDDPHITNEDKRKALETAKKYFELAYGYVKEEENERSHPEKTSPILIITCGLTGTGKSTVMNEVAEKEGLMILASDKIRKELVGIQPEEHRYEEFDKGIYSKELTERTYLHIIEEGKKLLMQGKSIVLDACFPKKWQRQKAFESVKEANARFLCIEFVLPEEEAKDRLKKRLDSREGISDGRWEIYVAQKESFEAVDEFLPENHAVVDTSKSKDVCVKVIVERLES